VPDIGGGAEVGVLVERGGAGGFEES